LHSVGYDGWLGMEDFSQTYPSEEAIQRNIEFVQKWL
jgi:sugar phosphate isomerase/epimerase